VRFRKTGAVTLAAGAGLLLGGCGIGWANPSYIRSPNPISTHLQNKVLYTLDQYGMPVDYDYVGCQGPDASGKVSCYAETSDTPKGAIIASFVVHHGVKGCPGTLTVQQNSSILAQVPANPCR
jgi:hypothetical protein